MGKRDNTDNINILTRKIITIISHVKINAFKQSSNIPSGYFLLVKQTIVYTGCIKNVDKSLSISRSASMYNVLY